MAIVLPCSNSFRPCATVNGAKSGLGLSLLPLICGLHHVANGLPLQLEQAVNCSENKPILAIPQHPHAGLGAGNDLISGARKRLSERADLQRLGPYFLNGRASSRKVEVVALGAISRRARNCRFRLLRLLAV